MPYQALYRKYRPTNFDEVVGQKHIVQTLKNAIVQDRVAHAYLFTGPRGTGKTSIAKIFAKMLNCEDAEHRPCGKCLNCELSQSGSHPDIIEIDAASNNGVDEVRNLIERVKYAPMHGKYKVYIIDEVHMMSTGAFNALLKTIEEPPAHVVFILATTEPHKVLPTIISRCQRFDFNKVAIKDIVNRLQFVCANENIEIEEQALQLIAQLAEGGMRDSLSILDQCIAYCPNHIQVDDVRAIYGVVTTEGIGMLHDHLQKKKVNELIHDLTEFSDQGMDLKRLCADYICLLKESLIIDYSSDTMLVTPEHKEVIRKYLIKSSHSFRLEVMDNLMDTYNKFNYASNLLDYLEAALLRSISSSYESISEKEVVSLKEKSNLNLERKEEIGKNISDFSSDSSDIHANKPINKSESLKTEEKNISDVSRETLKQEKNIDRKIILNDDFVLQLLVGASKQERQIDTNHMNSLPMYLSDLKTAKYASSLMNTNIIASANTYLVVCTKSEIESKQINSLQLEDGYETFTELLLGKAKKVFSMDKEQHERVIYKFKEARKLGTLPPACEITITKNENHMNEQESPEEIIRNLFPDVEVVND